MASSLLIYSDIHVFVVSCSSIKGNHFSINLSQTTKLHSSKLTELADHNFKSDINGRKFSKWVENNVGKEKLLVTWNFSFSRSILQTSMSNFSFSDSVFESLVLQTCKNQGLFGKGFM